jgi:hypothetical protein
MNRLSSRRVRISLIAVVALAAPAWADSATWTQQIITPEIALKAAQAAKAKCQKHGWQVSVTVADPAW